MVIEMALRFYFVFLCLLNIGASNLAAPKIRFPERHISFQAGKMGDKPWDPNASSTVLINFASAVFTKPVYVDGNFDLSPGIFKSWKWDFKTKSFILEINDKLQFNKNRSIKAIDVEYAFVKNFLSEFGFYSRASLEDIKGIQELVGKTKFKSGMCSGIKILSNNKIQIFMKSENSHFIYSLQDSLPFIAPLEDFKEDHFNFKVVPRGSGPYKIVWSDPKSSFIRLEKKNISKEDLKGSFPLSIDFLNEGEPIENKPDLATGAGSSGMDKLQGWKIEYGSVPDAHYTLDFNYTTELANDKNFRKALSHALDREKLIKMNKADRVSFELIPSKYMGRAGLNNPYDPKLAKKIIDSKLANIKGSKKPIKGIFHGQPGKIKPLPKLLMKQLDSLGIKTKIEGRRILRQFGKDKDAVFKINGVGLSRTDSLSCFTRYIAFEGPKNLAAPSGAKVFVQIYEKAKAAQSRVERAKYISELSKTFNDNYYAIPISESFPRFAYGMKIESIDSGNIFAAVNFLEVNLKKTHE